MIVLFVFVAQLVEQLTLNQRAVGSSPPEDTRIFQMHFVYILFSEKLRKYYVGSTGNIELRLNQHNNGHGNFTRTGTPWKLVYAEEFESVQLARQRERQIKKMKSKVYIENLISSNI